MRHRHLKDDVGYTPSAIEDILRRGTVLDWRHLAEEVKKYPHGRTAKSLERVLQNTYIYGTTVIWKELLKKWRNDHESKEDFCPDEYSKKC